MASENDRRISALEARISELERENAGHRAKSAPTPLPLDEGVRITYPIDYPIPMPTSREYEALLAIAERAGVVPRSVDEFEFFSGFVRSFERLASLRRLPGLDPNRSAHDWGAEAHRWLSERGTPADTTNGSFFAACIIAGDVPYSLAKPRLGIPALVGLTHDSGAISAQPAWRAVLDQGKPRPPNATTGG